MAGANDTAIDRENLRNRYRQVNFSPSAVDGLIQAHERVLELGKSTGWEWIVSVDCATGKFVGERTDKKPGRVSWKHEGNIAGVHNHPDSTTFSEADVYSFVCNKDARALSIQGHDGSFYILTRLNKDSKTLTKNCIKDSFESALLEDCFKTLSYAQRSEIAVKSLAS